MYIVPLFIPHAGCQHECTFCNQKIISGQTKFDMENVEKQMQAFLSFLPLNSEKQVAFYGGSFTALAEELQIKLLKYVEKYKKSCKITSIRISTRPDCINWENLILLKEYNVEIIELGVQALDNKVLTIAKRGHNQEIVHEAADLIKKAKIKLGLQLMVGMQAQDWPSIIESTKLVLLIKPDMVRIYSLMVLKGTELERLYLQGNFKPSSLETTVAQASYICQQLKQDHITVIRMGLQAEEVFQDNIVAGSYHPAFGELVWQHYYRNLIAKFADELQLTSRTKISIEYPDKIASKVVGLKKYNKIYFNQYYPNLSIKWQVNNELTAIKLAVRTI